MKKTKTYQKDTEGDLNKRKDMSFFCIRLHDIIKMSVLPKLIYKLNTILSKYQQGFWFVFVFFFFDVRQTDNQVHMEKQTSKKKQENTEKKNL